MKQGALVVAVGGVLWLGGAAQTPASLFSPAPGSPVAVCQRPGSVDVADFTADGHADLLVACSGNDALVVLLGDGRGGFRAAPGSPLAVRAAPHLVAVGDVNNDGRADFVATSHDSNDVSVLLGDGRGRFSPAAGSPLTFLERGTPHNHGLALGDLNGDGNLDLATSNQNDNSVSVLLGDGTGRFAAAPGSPFPVGRSPYPLALADVNGDGHLDVVTPNVRSNDISVLLGNGRGGFAAAPGSPIAVLARPYFVALGRLNADPHLDLVATHDDTTLASVLLGDGGGFRPAAGSPVDLGCRGGEVRLGDVNRDGRLDFVTGTACHSVVVLLGDGRGGLRAAPGSPLAVGRGPWGVALADLNGDGRLDIATADFESNSVSVLLRR
ncbi:MAG: VCBS repeat-containing protein [Acidobacteria bacterium]|nr:VCBS repeat-containing protein [Acidobacteriota bacterium]